MRVRDTRMLLNEFSIAIAISAPHVYVSMLPTMPDDSVVARHYLEKMHLTGLEVTRQGIKPQSHRLKSLVPASLNSVSMLCIAFSPRNSTEIAAGFQDGSIRVWELETGQLSYAPVERHTRMQRGPELTWLLKKNPLG